MANAPYDNEFVQLHIRHVPGGSFTDHVFLKMKEREILRFEAPLGTFALREDSTKPIVFVASGTGFAPIKSILETAFRAGNTRPMTLYWGGRRPKDLYMNDLPQQWAAEHANFRYVPVISDALPEDNWTGRSGFVHRAVSGPRQRCECHGRAERDDAQPDAAPARDQRCQRREGHHDHAQLPCCSDRRAGEQRADCFTVDRPGRRSGH